MIYELNGKNIRIPDEEIKKNMQILEISQDEAIQMYLEDEGYIINETVEKLTKKAKENGTAKVKAKSDKVRKPVKRERKPDEEKEKIIEILQNALKNAGIAAEITNKSKIIEFSIENNHYKLDLIKKRPKKS
jgi:hypothetical protein